MTVAPLPISGDQFQEILDRINEAIERVQRAVQDIFDAINALFDWLPGFLADRIRGAVESALNRLNQLLSQAWAKLNELFAKIGSPSTLLDAADQWRTAVGGPASEVAGSMDPSQFLSDSSWKGSAATEYTQQIAPHGRALNAIKDIATTLDDSLRNTAYAIAGFWAAVAAATVTAAVGLVAAIAVCAGVVTAPAGVAAAAGIVAVFITFLAGAVTAIIVMVSQLHSAYAEVDQKLVDSSNFPAGKWPKSVRDLSDGTVTDGDADWSLD